MQVKDVMREPILIPADASKKELLRIAKKHPKTPLFIVADHKTFLGDVHENDLFYMLLPNEEFEEVGVELGFGLEKKFFADKAQEVMRKHDISCAPSDDVMDVARLFAQSEVNEMPVLKDGQVVGYVTQGLLLRELEKA